MSKSFPPIASMARNIITVLTCLLAGCTSVRTPPDGHMRVTNTSSSIIQELRFRISDSSTSSGMPFDDATSSTAEVFIVKDLKPSESRDVAYHIPGEYYLDADAILASGRRLRHDYGYVE